MSRLVGKELTQALLERLNGRDVEAHEGKIIPIFTLDEFGWPHPALLSYYEVTAQNASTIDLGLWKNSSTANHLRRTGKVTLMITDKGVNYYLKGSVKELQAEMTGVPQVSRFRITTEELLEDQEANAEITSGLTYTRMKEREDTDIAADCLAPFARAAMNRKRILLILLTILVLAGTGYGFRLWSQGAKESPYISAEVQKGNVTQVVTATGSLSAVITVQVGSQVSGTIDKLYADFNSKVKKDQVVAQINQDKFKATVDQSRANLLAAQANVTKAKASLEDAQRTLDRNKELKKRDLIAQSEFDTSQAAYDSAVAQYEVNKAQVNQAQAALNQSSVDFNNTVIRSPVDGIVVSRNVDVGQTVAASLQAPVLFLIANDLSKMQVDTNVSEGDVGNVWVGPGCTFTVDAYPSPPLQGHGATGPQCGDYGPERRDL